MLNDAMKVTKIKNIYIMLLDAISNQDIDKVDHFLDDKLTERYRKRIKEFKEKNLIEKFGMLNITDVVIQNQNDKGFVATAVVKYAYYVYDPKNKKVVKGDQFQRTQKNVRLSFRYNYEKDKYVFNCPSCGAGLNINAGARCPCCNNPVDERFSEIVLEKID